MSEGIIVALIGLAGVLIVGWWNRERRKVGVEALKREEVAEAKPTVVEVKPKELPPREIDATHRELVETVEAATPYHQTSVENSLKGGIVCWAVKLQSISLRGEEITIYGDLVEDGSFVICRGQQGEAAGLETAKEGTVLEVKGAIEMVGRHETWLKNCLVKRRKK